MGGQYTLSYHFFRQNDARNHLELFLDVDGESPLETWRCFKKPEHSRTGRVRRFSAAPPHRRVYLEFAGVITGNRGKLRILRQGKFIDCRTGMFKVCAAHEVHLGADGRAGKPQPCHYIKVTL